MGRANCPQVAPDRFTRPGILPGVLVVTLPVVEGDIAFLQGHALAVEQRQTGRTQGIIAPFFSLGTLRLPLLGFTPLAISNSIASRSCWRGEKQCPSAGATPFHGALLGRGTEAGLAGIRLNQLFEGFWCDTATTTYWLTEPPIPLVE